MNSVNKLSVKIGRSSLLLLPLILLVIFLPSASIYAQETAFEEDESVISDYYKLPLIGLGTGLLTFNGDVGKSSSLKGFNRFKPGYNVYLEKRINGFLGVSLNSTFGKLSANELGGTHNNFESKIKQFDLNVVFHLDNGFILKKSNHTAPYFSAGISYLMFNSYGDLTDQNGKTYNYWSDGSIRDLPEIPANRFAAKVIKRDYTYETLLKDSTINYPRNTFSVPLTAGIAIKLNEKLALCLQGTYNMCLSDYIDNVSKGGPDSYLYTSAMIRYSLGGHHKDEDPRFKGVDFDAVANADSDGDGVKDVDDVCSGTPKSAKVDKHGCPLDDDNDGVPNYMDKEPNSPSRNVDQFGVTLTDELIEKTHQDTLAEEHSAVTALLKKKDAEIMNKVSSGNNDGKKSNLPAEFMEADLNKDGIITSAEISAAIDAFFEGGSNFTVEKLHRLIDYFFEQ